jgi:tetratricopeptide (TPR) repeat protein
MLEKALALLCRDPSQFPISDRLRNFFIAIASFLKASLEKSHHRYTTALALYMEAGSRFESAESVTELALSYTGIAHCLLLEQRAEEALSYATNAEDLLSSPDCDQKVANPIYEAIALAALTLGLVSKAKDALEQAVKHRHLESALPTSAPKEPENRSQRSSSTQSMPVPVPPAAPRPVNARARFKRGCAVKESCAVPMQELGRLRLSVSKLIACC